MCAAYSKLTVTYFGARNLKFTYLLDVLIIIKASSVILPVQLTAFRGEFLLIQLSHCRPQIRSSTAGHTGRVLRPLLYRLLS